MGLLLRKDRSLTAGGLPGGAGDAAGRRSGRRRWAAGAPGAGSPAPHCRPRLRLEIKTRVRDGESWLLWQVSPTGFEWVRMVRIVLSEMR